jgi:hypothetical protein
MPRTRLFRPAFFTDKLIASLPAWTQLTYVGLWTLADDAGYFERRPEEIALALFGHTRPATRERRVAAALELLVEKERVRWLDCGEHGVIPTLPEHGVMRGGNHSYNVKAKHDEACALTLFRARQAPMTREYVPGTNKSRSGSGSVSGSGSGSESDAPPRGLNETAATTGGFVATLAAKGVS